MVPQDFQLLFLHQLRYTVNNFITSFATRLLSSGIWLTRFGKPITEERTVDFFSLAKQEQRSPFFPWQPRANTFLPKLVLSHGGFP